MILHQLVSGVEIAQRWSDGRGDTASPQGVRAGQGPGAVTWQFTITGLFIGALVGLTGMGGGSLMTPLLILLFGFKPTLAVGTDILHGAVFKSFGAARHRRLGTVHAHLALWMFLGSAPMSLLGVQLGDYLENEYGDGLTTRSRR